MKITKLLHSCLLLQKGGDRVLFDPGKFSFVEGGARAADITGLTAVIMQNNPGAVLYGNAGIASALQPKGLKVELFEEGARQIGDFLIEAFEARHEKIVNAAIPSNTAYLVDERLLNPGDSYAYSLDALKGRFDVLALPVMAPWCTEMDSVGFAARMNAKRVLPIHDGYVKDFFLRMRYENYENHFGGQGVRFERPERCGGVVEV